MYSADAEYGEMMYSMVKGDAYQQKLGWLFPDAMTLSQLELKLGGERALN